MVSVRQLFEVKTECSTRFLRLFEGDKNASRAGQKGICSLLYNPEDLPFTEGGMVPDLIFNPHGFPSRMTMGMMVELLANKHAAVSGEFHESSTFKYGEENPSVDHFGKLLVERGFNFNGLETMYSGVSGQQLEAAIFFGPVYYQRLRHMVSDKIQGRTTGPVDPVGCLKRSLDLDKLCGDWCL